MSSARINLNGQTDGSFFCGNNVVDITIDRTFPAILDGRLSITAWTEFCDQVDNTLRPVSDIKRRLGKSMKIFPVFMCIPFFIVPVIIFTSDFYAENFWLFYLIPVFSIALFVVYGCYMKKIMNELFAILEDLKRVCADTSNRYSDVSFHVREEFVYTGGRRSTKLNYIQVLTSGPSASMMENGHINPAVPVTATPVFNSTFNALAGNTGNGVTPGNSKSTVERLQELDSIKSIISAEEYERKKKQILDGI